jgi:hypothetical protein
MEGNSISCAQRHLAFREEASLIGGLSAATPERVFALRVTKQKKRSLQSAGTWPFRALKSDRWSRKAEAAA